MTIALRARLKVLICLLPLILFGTDLSAQLPLRRDLTEGWLRVEPAGIGHGLPPGERTAIGDSVALSDSWMDQGLQGYDGALLYRRAIFSIEGRSGSISEPAVLIGPVAYGWYRLSVDGYLLGTYGSADSPTPFPRDQIYPIPPKLLRDGQAELLLEIHRVGWAADAVSPADPMVDGATFGPRGLLVWERDLARSNLRVRELGVLLVAVLALFFGLFHLVLFATRRDQLAYAWFGLSGVLMALNAIAFSPWLTSYFANLDWPYRLTATSGHLVTATLIPFVWGVLDRPLSRVLKGYQLSHVLLGCLTFLIPLPWVVQSEPLRFFWLVPILVAGLAVLLQDAWRGHPDARTLLLGGLVLALCELGELGRVMNLPIPRMLPNLGFMALILAMAGTLASRFSRTLASVTELRDGLELKVRERTAELEEMTRLAREADEAKGRFLVVVTHELQNPLKSITGFASLLIRDAGSRPLDKEKDYLERIRASGSRLLALSQELLDLARIEAGKLAIRMEDVDVVSLVQSVRDELAGQVLGDPVGIVIESPESLDTIRSDPLRLRQILLNLGGNGIRFMDEGHLAIRVLSQGSRPLAIEVVDNGPGIPEDQMEDIFEPFHRGIQAKRSTHGGGAGLGLSIARSLSDILGYTLKVRSEVGEGATFVLEFSGKDSPLLHGPCIEVQAQGEEEDQCAEHDSEGIPHDLQAVGEEEVVNGGDDHGKE